MTTMGTETKMGIEPKAFPVINKIYILFSDLIDLARTDGNSTAGEVLMP